jgi:hypothetical protein
MDLGLTSELALALVVAAKGRAAGMTRQGSGFVPPVG